MTARRAGVLAGLVLAVALAAAGLVRAAAPDPTPTFEERVAAVAETIRCPTCKGLSIQDSPSVLADGSRQIVEEQLQQGRTPNQVRAYFVSRYGADAVLTPDPGGVGLLAWLLPAVGLPVAGWWGWRRLRGPLRAAVGDADADAVTALAASRAGTLEPDSSPAGETLREALAVRLAAAEDGLEASAVARADARLGAAYRRYARRADVSSRQGPLLPRRALTVLTVLALLVGTGAALAVGVRTRGAGDLPTGDLPGGVAADPGLGALLAATRERPDDAGAWVALGRAYDAGGQLASAVRSYDRALALRPAADDVQLLRAAVLVRGGSVAEALPVLEQLAVRYPDDPDTLLVLGNAQDILGRPEAERTLRRFLELAPDAPAAATVREQLAAR